MQNILLLAKLIFFKNSFLLEVDGFVFGISNIDVMPPIIAARLPEYKSSESVAPGSLKWTWVSIAPGNTNKFFASTT